MMNNRRTGAFVSASILLLLLLAACAPSPIDLNDITTLPTSEGIVYGRLKIVSNGIEQESFSTFFGESTMSLVVVPIGSSEGTLFPLREKGHFFWHLPKGDYVIASFEGIATGFSSFQINGRIFANFSVDPERATYIGTLNLLFEDSRYLKFVEDEYEPAANEYRRRFPHMIQPTAKGLMTLEVER